MSAPTPGWYLDPEDRLRHRYWDGERWQSQRERLGSPPREVGSLGGCPEESADAP